MALDRYQDFPFLIGHLRSLQPTSILEIGVGNGVNGLIARELLDHKLCRRSHPQYWTTRIDGIVNQPDGMHPHLSHIYSQVLTGRAVDIIKSLPEYDLILIKDTFEHESRADAARLLEECIAHSNRQVIVSVRVGKTWQTLNADNPMFGQSSTWYPEDFTYFSPAYEIIDGPLGPYGIFPIIKKDYLIYKNNLLSASEKPVNGIFVDPSAGLPINRADIARIDLSSLAPFVADESHLPYFLDPDGKEHYRLAAFLGTCFNHAQIFDVGTNKGYSALALSYNRTNKIISYDITDAKALNRQEELDRIEFRIGDVLQDDRLLFAPLIMLDTDHDGVFETEFFNFLRTHDYKGLVLLDDIHVSSAMIRFWVSIDEPRLDLTELGHFSGSGLVDFSKNNGP